VYAVISRGTRCNFLRGEVRGRKESEVTGEAQSVGPAAARGSMTEDEGVRDAHVLSHIVSGCQPMDSAW
jgi:hypothetical protein